MSIEQSYTFDNAANFNLFNAQIESNRGKLALIDNAGQVFEQMFDNDTGFTYDSAKAEFAAGVVRQKELLPNSLVGINYSSSINANWSSGAVTAIGVNSPVVSGGKLVLNGTNYVQYEKVSGFFGNPYQGCIRFKITPNYSGAPATQQRFFGLQRSISSSLGSIFFYHLNGSGAIGYSIRNALNAIVASGTMPAWNPTSGQEYVFEFNMDLTSGVSRLFIDGVQFGSNITGTSNNRQNPTILVIGAANDGSSPTDASFDDVLVFDSPQNTSNHSPTYSVSNFRFAGSKVDLPVFPYTGIGTIQAVENSAVVETGTPRYIVGGFYWNGSDWVVSNGTYAQASSSADVITNLPALTVTGAPAITVSVLFTDSNTQSSVDSLSVTVTGQKYSPTGRIEPAQGLQAKALVSYSDTVTETGNATIGRVIKVDGVPKYWDGDSWETSDLSEAQTNSESEINDNISALVLGQNSTIYPCWLFFSSSNTETAEIETSSISYNFGLVATDPITCLIVGYVRNISGVGIDGVKLNFKINASSLKYHEASKNITSPLTVTATTNENGYFSIPLVRSSEYENEIDYIVTIDYGESNTVEKSISGKLLFDVPDAETKDITDLLPTAA